MPHLIQVVQFFQRVLSASRSAGRHRLLSSLNGGHGHNVLNVGALAFELVQEVDNVCRVTAVVLFGGSLVIESMFALNGMGKLMIDALRNADYDLVLFMQLFYVAMSLLGNLIVDLVYGLVDPRVRVDK